MHTMRGMQYTTKALNLKNTKVHFIRQYAPKIRKNTTRSTNANISPAREITQDFSLTRGKKATVVMQDTAKRFYSHPTNSFAQLKKSNSS